MRKSRSIEARMAWHGFILTGMGGNTSAYVRESGDDFNEVITLEDDPWQAPTRKSDVVTIGDYPGDSLGQADAAREVTGFTLGEVLDSLEHPDDSYQLLTLRLENGIGVELHHAGHVYGHPSCRCPRCSERRKNLNRSKE